MTAFHLVRRHRSLLLARRRRDQHPAALAVCPAFLVVIFVLLPLLSSVAVTTAYTAVTPQKQQPRQRQQHPIPPTISPATKLPNQLYQWKGGQQIRYQQAGPYTGQPVLLVHGLFVNSDHWRKTLLGLADSGYNVYAIDLWGYGYSSKPPFDSPEAQAVNGETRRFGSISGDGAGDSTANGAARPTLVADILEKVKLGTPDGKGVRVRDVELRHPVRSPYNFYTWSDLITDFVQDVIAKDGSMDDPDKGGKPAPVTLVSNSIGTISALQAVLDTPDLYTGVCVVTPNFRELHSAEVALPALTLPLIRVIQRLLREKGQALFDALATPSTVKQILREPYKIQEAIDDTLVQVLLDPLLLEGASKVVFDTLSYSAGPLPEQQLEGFPPNKPVWITYGTADPWTPEARVDALVQKACVERVVALPGVGHCPHDEAPELVNPFILDFLKRVHGQSVTPEEKKRSGR
jgi:pimeloyl-ACP methyl ester carboxylesterase